MSLPVIVQPLVITGPAILKWLGYVYYFKDGLKEAYTRETWAVGSDFGGDFSERFKSAKTVLSGTPVGMMSLFTTASNKSAMFPYTRAQIGQPGAVMGTPASPNTVVIQTQFGGASNTGQTITFVRGGMTKHPTVQLGSQKTLCGATEFTCIGNPTTANNAAGSWEATVDAAFADTSFDETQIISDIYTAAFGSTPYDSIGSHNGFEVDIPLKLNEGMSDDYGIIDVNIDGMGPATAKFAPSNLTQAQIWTMMNAQGTNVIQPGMDIAKPGTTLAIGGTGNGAHTLAVSLPKMGPKSMGFTYDKKNNRVTEVAFVGSSSWTSGAPVALATFTVT